MTAQRSRTNGVLVSSAAIVVLGASTLAQFALYAAATRASKGRPAWDDLVPGPTAGDPHWGIGAGATIVALALVQVAALDVLRRAMTARNAKRVLGIAAIVAAGVSVAAVRAAYVTSDDVYAYLAYARLPTLHEAYAPPGAALPEPFAVLNEIWGRPLVPAAYGPLDLVLYRAVSGSQATLAGAFEAARLLGLATVALLALLAYALTRRAELVALVILNPGLYHEMVVDGHNDLIAVDLVLAGMLVARRNVYAGAILAASSSLVKINFAFFAGAFAPPGTSRSVRAALYAGAIVLSFAASAALGGTAYVHALTTVAHATGPQPDRSGLRAVVGASAHIALAIFGALAIAASTLGIAAPASFAWSFFGLGVALNANYLVWGLPYALSREGAAGRFLTLLPLASVLADYALPGAGNLLRVALVAYMLYETFRDVRSRRLSAAPSGSLRRA